MDTATWTKIKKAAGCTYELGSFDRANMLECDPVFRLVEAGNYRKAVEVWFANSNY